MADQPIDKPEATPPFASAPDAPAAEAKPSEPELSAVEGDKPDGQAATEEAKIDEEPKPAESAEEPATEDATEKTEEVDTKPTADVEMKDATETTADDAPAAVAETPAAKGKARRKSTADSKSKTLSRKASKARLTHTDAKPGDHFLVKLKGFPAWPAIICEESMLPQALLTSRPVTAARPDGSYADAYADGGKRINDRTFPVMYLYTNEFGWVSNTALTDLPPDKARDSITDKQRKDLRAAYELAAENNPVEHYKDVLQKILEEFEAQKKAAEEAAATPKPKKGKAKVEDDDLDMDDVEEVTKSAKSKKRKAEEDTNTPQRSDSTKRPKIKLNTTSTPKAANGTPKAKDESAAKSKSKPKKTKEAGDKKADAPKEIKMTAEERHARKEKEVLYLRHKLQRGLLTRDQEPQEAEMKQMSEFITMLENFAELEVSIIRTTKINKVLKAILKLDSIPREDEFQFKKRSQALLDRWNKLMATDGGPSATTNGINGTAEATEKKPEPNGVKDSVETTKSETPKPAGDAVGQEDAKDEPTDAKDEPKFTEDATEKVSAAAPTLPSATVEAGA